MVDALLVTLCLAVAGLLGYVHYQAVVITILAETARRAGARPDDVDWATSFMVRKL